VQSINDKLTKPLLCSVVFGVKTKKIAQMFDTVCPIQTSVLFSNIKPGLNSVEHTYLTKPKSRYPSDTCQASMPVSNLAATLSTITHTPLTTTPPTSTLNTLPNPQTDVTYINMLTSSLALLANRFVGKHKAVCIACDVVLGADLGLSTPGILIVRLEDMDGENSNNEELPIYKATKASSEVMLEAFRQNYMATLGYRD